VRVVQRRVYAYRAGAAASEPCNQHELGQWSGNPGIARMAYRSGIVVGVMAHRRLADEQQQQQQAPSPPHGSRELEVDRAVRGLSEN
jgi:hypothetical protein